MTRNQRGISTPIVPLVEKRDLDVCTSATDGHSAPLPVRAEPTEGIDTLINDLGDKGDTVQLSSHHARLPFGDRAESARDAGVTKEDTRTHLRTNTARKPVPDPAGRSQGRRTN